MTGLGMLITEYLDMLAPLFYIRQCLVIVAVYIFGAIITDCFAGPAMMPLKRACLAFPVGISAFSITSYVMLVAAVPYTWLAVTAATLIEIIIVIALGRKAHRFTYDRRHIRNMTITLAAVIVIALIATSGLAPVSITNDTMYYFRRYPDAIVYYGHLRDQFDFFLTDTGLGSVCIDALPALFGFGESFGIREFFHINFTIFFGVTVYERGLKYMVRQKAVVSAFLITIFLAVSTPFVILGHWSLANMYFMELFFISAYSFLDNENTGLPNNCIMMVALSLLRIEGTLFVVWLAVCLALYTKKAGEMAKYVLMPMAVLFGSYCIKLYTSYIILDNPYTFLTPAKAVLLTALIVVAGVYLLFIYPRIYGIFKMKLSAIYIAAMILGNILFLFRDRDLYIGNLKAFGSNLFRQSGWGMLPYYVVAMTVMLAVEYVILFRRNKTGCLIGSSDSFNIIMVLGFILLVLAASYGRGDVLSEGAGDSGNRVLLQITPLITMMYGELFMKLYSLM